MAAESTEPQAKQDTISAFMASEHQRISEMWTRTLAALNAEQFTQLHSQAGEFIAALKRHIHTEEQILFPAIEEKSGDTEPTEVMRMEHHQMERIMEKLKPLLTVQELWTGIQAVEGQEIEPGAMLRSHENKEHDVLFPLADKVLSAEEAQTLIAKIRAEVDKA